MVTMAHAYSTDSADRRYIPFFIAAAAVGAAFLAFHFLDKYQIQVPWWASPPIDTMAFYGLFYWFFDRFAWKWRLLHWLPLTRVPDVSGEWRGHVRPTPTVGISAGLGKQSNVTISIRQTWTKILVISQTSLSNSRSLSGSLIVTDECSLSYEYLNEPSAAAPDTMHTHRGMARLTLDPSGTILDGEYYSGRDRQNIGTIRVTRVKTLRAPKA